MKSRRVVSTFLCFAVVCWVLLASARANAATLVGQGAIVAWGGTQVDDDYGIAGPPCVTSTYGNNGSPVEVDNCDTMSGPNGPIWWEFFSDGTIHHVYFNGNTPVDSGLCISTPSGSPGAGITLAPCYQCGLRGCYRNAGTGWGYLYPGADGGLASLDYSGICINLASLEVNTQATAASCNALVGQVFVPMVWPSWWSPDPFTMPVPVAFENSANTSLCAHSYNGYLAEDINVESCSATDQNQWFLFTFYGCYGPIGNAWCNTVQGSGQYEYYMLTLAGYTTQTSTYYPVDWNGMNNTAAYWTAKSGFPADNAWYYSPYGQLHNAATNSGVYDDTCLDMDNGQIGPGATVVENYCNNQNPPNTQSWKMYIPGFPHD